MAAPGLLPGEVMYRAKDFNSTERSLGGTDLRVDVKSVPVRDARGRWNHIAGLACVIDPQIDSAGTGSSGYEGQRLYGLINNLRFAYLNGTVRPLKGGTDIDLRLLRFFAGMREGQPNYGMGDPGDLDFSSSGTDVADELHFMYRFGRMRDGRRNRDGLIPRALFVDPEGSDAFYFDVPSTIPGDPTGNTYDQLNALRFYWIVRPLELPVLCPEQTIRYNRTSETEAVRIEPANKDRPDHRTEYSGLRQLEEDTEALTFANSGSWSVQIGDDIIYSGRDVAQIQEMHRFRTLPMRAGVSDSPEDEQGAADADDLDPITGHFPFIWTGIGADLTEQGRTPVKWDSTSLGSSRSNVRQATLEHYPLSRAQEAAVAKIFRVQPSSLRKENPGRVVSIDAGLLPRRIQVPA